MATIPSEDPTQEPILTPPGQAQAPDPAHDPNAWVRWFAWYKRASRPLQIGLGCGAVFFACAFCSVAIGALASGSHGGTPAAVPQATTVPIAATRNPAATANPNASVAAYLAVVTAHSGTLGTALGQVSTDCGPTDAQALATCRGDLQAVHDGAVDFISALDGQPAPPCLQTVDQQLREGLTSLENGATLGMQDIDDNNGADLQAGGTLISNGNVNIQAAATAINHAAC